MSNSVLAGKGKIYHFLDYYSAMFQHCSIDTILEYFKIPDRADEFYSSCAMQAMAGGYYVKFFVKGIFIYVSCDFFEAQDFKTETDFFSFVWPKVRVCISSEGLFELRSFFSSFGEDFDEFIKLDPSSWFMSRGVNFHLTRIDFTYDFVNYCGDLLDRMQEYCHLSSLAKVDKNGDPSNYLSCVGFVGGVSYRHVKGSAENTLYLGSSRTDRMLRVYDKKLQLCRDGAWAEANPFVQLYGHPDSWIRVEFQTRDDWSNRLLYSTIDLKDGSDNYNALSMLKYIYELFSFRDLTEINKQRSHKIAHFWQDMFDWDLVPRILQNLHVNQFVSYLEKRRLGVDRSCMSIVCVIAADGREAFDSRISNYYSDLILNRSTIAGSRRFFAVLDALRKTMDGRPFSECPNIYYSKVFPGVPLIRGIPIYDQEGRLVLDGSGR